MLELKTRRIYNLVCEHSKNKGWVPDDISNTTCGWRIAADGGV